MRRDLHRHPEVGFTEFRTASIVVRRLESLGYEVHYGPEVMVAQERMGVPSDSELQAAYERALSEDANPAVLKKMQGGLTGIVATLAKGSKGEVMAVRFDMDALPVQESTSEHHRPAQLGFESQHPGQMHACGHDGHTSIGLAFAEKMVNTPFEGVLKLIFQPAEEGGRGAYAMVQAGVADDVDYFFGLHLGLDLPDGAVSGGTHEFLASTKMQAHFQGIAAHAAAAPEQGRNALLGAASALMNIHAVPRFSGGPTRVNVGMLHGGTAANIIAEQATMTLECRAESSDIHADLEHRVTSILEYSAKMHGLDLSITVTGKTIAAKCDDELVQIAMAEAQQVNGFTSVKPSHPLGASEDATFFMERVQNRGGKATYMVVGTPIPAPHHNPRFDIREDALERAVNVLERIALKLLSSKGK
ncbi:amidohydrolase [Alicyclobacillus sp. SO9]|nr:amidohydrolase [Alicyclobacillus sp. SO9]